MTLTKETNRKVNVSDLLNQYEKIMDPVPEEEQVKNNTENNKENEAKSAELMPQKTDHSSLISFNNKDNPQISIFDAYAFNEVMRRYENSIVQLTKQDIAIKEHDNDVEKIKLEYENKLIELREETDNFEQLRDTLDQVNVILDEKDDKILEYSTMLNKKNYEIDKIKKIIKEKEEIIKKMESQLYSVLFKVTEHNTCV
jgi:hypothetical protein